MDGRIKTFQRKAETAIAIKETMIIQTIKGQVMVFKILVNDLKSMLLIIHLARTAVKATFARITIDPLMTLLSFLQILAIFIT